MIESSPAGHTYNTSIAMEFFRFAGKAKAFAKGKKIFSENQRGIPFLMMPDRMYLLLDGESASSRGKPVATTTRSDLRRNGVDRSGPRTAPRSQDRVPRDHAHTQMRAALGDIGIRPCCSGDDQPASRVHQPVGTSTRQGPTKWMQPAPLRGISSKTSRACLRGAPELPQRRLHRA
jgi:hypothetical protein